MNDLNLVNNIAVKVFIDDKIKFLSITKIFNRFLLPYLSHISNNSPIRACYFTNTIEKVEEVAYSVENQVLTLNLDVTHSYFKNHSDEMLELAKETLNELLCLPNRFLPEIETIETSLPSLFSFINQFDVKPLSEIVVPARKQNSKNSISKKLQP